MLSLNYENINDVISQILKLSCVSFRYVSISYVLALRGVVNSVPVRWKISIMRRSFLPAQHSHGCCCTRFLIPNSPRRCMRPFAIVAIGDHGRDFATLFWNFFKKFFL